MNWASFVADEFKVDVITPNGMAIDVWVTHSAGSPEPDYAVGTDVDDVPAAIEWDTVSEQWYLMPIATLKGNVRWSRRGKWVTT